MAVKTLTLKYPVTQGSETISELVFERRLRAKDFRGLPLNLGFDDMFTLLSRLTANPPSVIDELDTEDLMAAVEVVSDFLPVGLKIGGKRSGS